MDRKKIMEALIQIGMDAKPVISHPAYQTGILFVLTFGLLINDNVSSIVLSRRAYTNFDETISQAVTEFVEETTEMAIEETATTLETLEAPLTTAEAVQSTIEETSEAPATTVETLEVSSSTTSITSDASSNATQTTVEETITEAVSTEAPTTKYEEYGFTQREYILLCNVVAQEYGADRTPVKEKAKVVEVVLNRVASEDYPDTIYEVITQPYQFTGSENYSELTTYSDRVTDSVIEAVDWYLENSWSNHGYTCFYGDGECNYFS